MTQSIAPTDHAFPGLRPAHPGNRPGDMPIRVAGRGRGRRPARLEPFARPVPPDLGVSQP